MRKSWLADDFEILSRGLNVDSKQLFLITFCRIYHIKGTLLYRKIGFLKISKTHLNLIFKTKILLKISL
jgi:hypothetical protein